MVYVGLVKRLALLTRQITQIVNILILKVKINKMI